MSNQVNVDELIERLDKLAECLDEVRKKSNKKINVFRAVGMTTHEIRHSKFFAWLLDKTNPHNFGIDVLKAFLEKLYEYKQDPNAHSFKANADIIKDSEVADDKEKFLALVNDGNIEVLTEKVICDKENRIDILIVFHANKTVILVENKIAAKLGDDQLYRYECEIGKENSPYKDYKKIYVYLRNDDSLPYIVDTNGNIEHKENWCLFNYYHIKNIIELLIEKVETKKEHEKAENKLLNLLEDYMDILDTEILKNNKSLNKKCKDIKNKYANEIKLLYEYTDNCEEVVGFCREQLKKELGSFNLYSEATNSINFYTDNLKKYFKKFGEDITDKRGFGRYYCGTDGDIIACFLMDKMGDWTKSQKKLIELKGVSDDKQTHMDLRVTLLKQEKRFYRFDEIKAELEDNLKEFIEKVKNFEEEIMNIQIDFNQ